MRLWVKVRPPGEWGYEWESECEVIIYSDPNPVAPHQRATRKPQLLYCCQS